MVNYAVPSFKYYLSIVFDYKTSFVLSSKDNRECEFRTVL